MKNTDKKTDKSESKSAEIVKANDDAATELRTLFVDSLKDIYWAENALVGALPKMKANATSPNLISAIDDHLMVTKNQVKRLDEVFKSLGEKAEGKKCEAMAGLLKEGEGILEETTSGMVRDAGIIAASQKIEHYEIATYGTLCAFAKTLGENDVAEMLAKSLAEEKEADMLLSTVASSTVNAKAAKA